MDLISLSEVDMEDLSRYQELQKKSRMKHLENLEMIDFSSEVDMGKGLWCRYLQLQSMKMRE